MGFICCGEGETVMKEEVDSMLQYATRFNHNLLNLLPLYRPPFVLQIMF